MGNSRIATPRPAVRSSSSRLCTSQPAATRSESMCYASFLLRRFRHDAPKARNLLQETYIFDLHLTVFLLQPSRKERSKVNEYTFNRSGASSIVSTEGYRAVSRIEQNLAVDMKHALE